MSSINKKTMSIITFLLIILILISGFYIRKNKIEEKRLEIAKEFGENIISLYKNENIIFNKNSLTEETIEKLEKYKKELKDKDEQYVVIAKKEEIIGFLNEDIAGGPSIDDEVEDIKNQQVKDYDEKDFIPKGSLVYEKDGEYRVKAKELELSTPEYALVDFMDGDYKIFKSEIPETYESIKKNPKYSYILRKIERKEDLKLVLIFESVYNNSTKILELEISKKINPKIIDFKF